MARADGQQTVELARRRKRGLPFPIRTLGAGEAGARRRLLARWPAPGTELRLERLSGLIGGEALLTLEGAGRVERVAAEGATLAVALADPGGPRAVLGLPAGLARRLVDLVLGRAATRGGPGLTTGEEGALLFALDRAAGDWIGAGGVRFEIRGLLAGVEQVSLLLPEGEVWRVTARLAARGLEGTGWIWCAAPKAGSPRFVTVPDPLPDKVAVWPMQVGIEVGASRLPLAAVRKLEPGDLVVLDRLAHPDGATGGGEAQLVSGAFARTIRWLDATRLEVISETGERTPMETPGDGGAVRARTLDGPDDGGAPDVVVRVEVARVRMTVGEAMGLLPGQILQLDRPVDAEVVLRVGDGRIAAGVLVEHEGALAVEITEVP